MTVSGLAQIKAAFPPNPEKDNVLSEFYRRRHLAMEPFMRKMKGGVSEREQKYYSVDSKCNLAFLATPIPEKRRCLPQHLYLKDCHQPVSGFK